MIVYLLRHGIAAERDAEKFPNDDERPLTGKGIARMKEEARGIRTIIERPDFVLTSPLVRTRQTADLVARALGCEDCVEDCDALKPGATADAVRTLLRSKAREKPQSVMLVGHEPDMGEIASALIGTKTAVIEFKKGSLCTICLGDENLAQPGTLLWHLTPRQLISIGKSK